MNLSYSSEKYINARFTEATILEKNIPKITARKVKLNYKRNSFQFKIALQCGLTQLKLENNGVTFMRFCLLDTPGSFFANQWRINFCLLN